MAKVCPALRHVAGLRRAISERVHSKTLNALESGRLVHREVIDMMLPHVEYRLMPLGTEAVVRLRPLAYWIEDSLPRVGAEWARRGVIGPDGAVRLPE